MLAPLFLMLIVVPIVELIVILRVADSIGFVETILLLIAVSAIGAWLLKQQGTTTWKRFNEALARGEMPTKEATDGVLIVIGGALLLTPGFVTDAVGLVLLFPVTRAFLKGATRRLVGGWARRRMGIPGVYSTTAVRRRVRTRPEGDMEVLLPEAVDDDSPDKE
jgi:UPF0716 protein FxsA